VIAGAAMLVLAGCGSNPDETAESPSATPMSTESATTAATSAPEPQAEPEPAADGTTLTTGSSPFGTMLFDASNQAVYIWEVETSSTPQCYDDCEVAWPPVLTDGAPVAAGEVRADLLGTVPRSDGSTQVTYNGHPLYYYAHEAPGEVKCHNIATHGGMWWVVQPDGNRAP
jgi:predicted lipoprotein with Yx(FWY)xxD motif